MNFYGLKVNEIHELPISKYNMLITECFNITTLKLGGEYNYSNQDEKLMFKKMVAYNEIQNLKVKGKWQ